MIPQHLVYRAAQAMWEVGTSSEWRDDVWAAPHLTRARAALEAVAADIWDQGHQTRVQRGPDECTCNAWNEDECACGNYGTGPITTPNPYKVNP